MLKKLISGIDKLADALWPFSALFILITLFYMLGVCMVGASIPHGKCMNPITLEVSNCDEG